MATQSLDALRIDRSSSRPRSGRALAWVAVLLIVAGAVAGTWWWLARPRVLPVRVVMARETSVGERAAVLNASGYVTARRRATVSSKITGKVMEVHVEEGMAVQRGQVLARLDASSVQSYLNLAEAQLTAARNAWVETEVRLTDARRTVDRTQELVAEGLTGRAVLDSAQAEADSLQARLALQRQEVAVAERQVAVRRTEIDDTIIRAPFSGIAISKDAQPGEMVSPVSAGGGFTRTGICTIVDMSSLEIEIEVNESYINRVKPGQKVTATLDAYPDWPVPAKVITIVPAADRQKATVLVRLGFDQLDPRILPDMGVKVAFFDDQPETAPVAQAPRLLVPKKAVRSESGQSVVYVVKQDQADRRAVRTGGTVGDQIEVLSGISSGEQVIAEPPAELTNGARVVVQ
jgi:HlyD family secretion protein